MVYNLGKKDLYSKELFCFNAESFFLKDLAYILELYYSLNEEFLLLEEGLFYIDLNLFFSDKFPY